MELSFQLWKAQESEKAKITFLHGMGGTGALWRPIVAGIENHFSCLALDQRGHGKSRVAHTPGARTGPRYTPLDYGQDVVETLDKLSFRPSWFVGHSMGVRTACAAAHLQPEWTRGLVLVDLGFSGVAGGGLGDGLAQFLRTLPMEFESREEARQFMMENCPDPSISQYLMAVSVRTPEGGLTFPFDKAALIATIEAARDTSVSTWVQELGERRTPILVLRGAQSLVWSHEEFEAEKAQFIDIPSIRFEEVPGAGHGLPFEKRAEFVAMIQEFVVGN